MLACRVYEAGTLKTISGTTGISTSIPAEPIDYARTSAIVPVLNSTDPDFERVAGELRADSGPWLVPTAILSEIGYMLETRLPTKALDDFLSDLEVGYYVLECGDGEVARVRALTQRYADMPLGLADAAVVACADRNGGRALSLDHRYFSALAHEGLIQLLP